jgi:hypothetical protein
LEKIIADQQALLALLGYRGNKSYTQGVISEANSQRNLSDGKTAGDLGFLLMSEQHGFKLGQLDNERDFQEMDSVKPLSDSLGYLSDKLLKYAEEYPGLTRLFLMQLLELKQWLRLRRYWCDKMDVRTGGWGDQQAQIP